VLPKTADNNANSPLQIAAYNLPEPSMKTPANYAHEID